MPSVSFIGTIELVNCDCNGAVSLTWEILPGTNIKI